MNLEPVLYPDEGSAPAQPYGDEAAHLLKRAQYVLATTTDRFVDGFYVGLRRKTAASMQLNFLDDNELWAVKRRQSNYLAVLLDPHLTE